MQNYNAMNYAQYCLPLLFLALLFIFITGEKKSVKISEEKQSKWNGKTFD